MPVEEVDERTANGVQGDIDTRAFSDSLLILAVVIGDFFLPTIILSFHYQHRIAPWALIFLFLTDSKMW